MASIRVQATADGDNTVIAAPGAGKAIVVFGFVLTGQTTAGTALLRSGAAGTVHADLSLGTSGGVDFQGTERNPAFICDTNAAFVINNSAGLDTKGMVQYSIVAG
jgi:hypothetical protein